MNHSSTLQAEICTPCCKELVSSLSYTETFAKGKAIDLQSRCGCKQKQLNPRAKQKNKLPKKKSCFN